jgi:hypothetical protein
VRVKRVIAWSMGKHARRGAWAGCLRFAGWMMLVAAVINVLYLSVAASLRLGTGIATLSTDGSAKTAGPRGRGLGSTRLLIVSVCKRSLTTRVARRARGPRD